MKALKRKHDESGATLVEYVFLTALIALVCIAALTFVGQKPKAPLSSAGSALAL